MPPKRKRVGRPPGSKNKKTVADDETNTNMVKSEETLDKSLYEKNEVVEYMNRIRKIDILPQNKIRYNCSECSKRFRFRRSFIEHLKKEHSKLPGSVSCSQCHVCCPNKKTLKEHIANVHNRKIFKCPHCGNEFVRHSHVLRHMAQKGCDGQGVSLHPCEICSAHFTRKDNLMVHLRLQHINAKQFICKHCPYSTSNFSKLIVHVQKLHEGSRFECDKCGKITGSRASMTKHLEIHGEKKYGCDVCGYSTFTIEVIRRHVLTHVQNKPYKCSVCDQSFIQRSQLQRHQLKHKPEDTAGNVDPKKEPTAAVKLSCPHPSCSLSKKEMTRGALKRHMNTHTEDRPFECGVCYKKFHSEVYMRRHVMSHTLERPRRCMYCVAARAYVRGEQLVRHVRKAHPAVFRDHLAHVRQVMGTQLTIERVKKSELESILNVLDAETDRIIQGYGEGVLYGGIQEVEPLTESDTLEVPLKRENSPLMSEQDLADNLNKLLSQMIDKNMLECFGWPDESVDVVLEKVIEQCGARPADREKWTRVQRLRENAKHLFLYVIEDKNISRMLDTHTIDQIVKHILEQVANDADSKQ